MGYLICDRCKGYYELQPGEKIGDFDKCRCGGELRWVAKLPKQYQDADTTDKKDEEVTNLFPCPDCGYKISRKAKSCPNCGYKLTYVDKHGQTRPFVESFFILTAGAFILQYFLGWFVWILWIVMVLIVYFEKKNKRINKNG